MKSRAFCAVLLILQICLILIDFSTANSETDSNVNNSTEEDEHNKLLLDCQHPDYRTYIKCLKRHKRHHWHDDGGDNKHKCFEDCGMDQCESSKCVHECHKRCMKKTKETRQIITQYETTCDSDDCKENAKSVDLPTTNITTNIDINNVINNHMPKPEVPKGGGTGTNTGGGGGGGTTGGGGEGGGGTGKTGGGTTPNGVAPPCSGGGGGWFGNTGLTLIPQIQLVPQLTFGLGAGGFGGFGGGYWSHGQAGGIDCSLCGNPLMRYKCDVSCYAVQGTGQMNQNTGRVQTGNAGCQSPQCIGGV